MSWMFYGYSGLTNLDVSNFKTDNVTNMIGMFSGCTGLTSLDLSNFNTEKVTYLDEMFSGCSGLTNLDVSNFKTDNVTDMGDMFSGCSGLTSLDLNNFNTDNVTNMGYMFSGCSGLTNLDVSNFKTDNVTNMGYMFNGCSSLTTLDVSNFNTVNVTNMKYMFYGCSSLTTIYAGNGWSTAAVTTGPNGRSMFYGCEKLVGGAGTTYSISYTNYTYAHIDGGLDNPGYFTAKNQETDNKFSTCAEVGAGEDGKTYRVRGRVKSISNTTFGNWYIEDATDSLYIYGTVDYVGRYPRDGMSWESYGINVGDTVTIQGPKSTYKGVPELVDVRVLSPITLLNVSSNDTAMIAMINRESIRLAPNAATVTAKLYYAGSNCEVTIPDHAQSWLTLQSIEANNGDAEAIFSISDNITTGKRGAEVLFKTSNDSIVYETALFISQNDLELSPYAVLTTDSTSVLSSDSTGVTYGKTLTFYYDNQKEAKGGMDVGLFESSSERGWNSNADSITVVVFDDSFANCTTLTSTALWFSGCRNLKTIVGIENLKTDHVTTMFAMFDCCNSLTSLDVSKFNTENVTRMNDMFSDCRSLTSLDVTNFNTAKVTDMCGMFINCSSLTSLDVSNFKTDSVTNMSFMFIECSGLTSLDLSNFNTAKVTDMSKMFAHCSGLTTIYVGEEWSTASVTDGTDMFKGCSAIKGGKGTTYSETFTIAYGNSTSSDYARIDYKGMPGYFTPKYGYTPEPTYTLEGNVLTIKAPIESSVYYVITDLYSGIDFESGDSLRIPETLYTGPLTLDHPVRVRFMAVNGRIAHSEIIVVKYKPIEATFDGRVLAVGGSTTMTDALESVGGRNEVAKTITAIVWNSSATLTNSDLQGLDNPNLLIYVNERSQAPQNRNNVVVNGLAMNVVLSDTGSGNCDFYAPQTFTAEMITYSREFKQATQVGVCRGWETISLPFMVQTIAHADNGVITPFGVDTSNKHFWLRQLSTNGLVSATKIEANVPYLISMPNDEKNYAKEYILKGLVTFSAQNAVVPKTEPMALALADSSIVMMPALQSVGKSSTVWALNVGMERSQYFEGSTFERDYREVRPFEAYTIHRSDSPAPRFLPINDLMNSATGIETISNVIMTHDNYYHIDGRKVDGKPTKKGLYITNGRKVVIK